MTEIYGFIRRDDADDFVLRKVNTRSTKKKGYFKHQTTVGNAWKEDMEKNENGRKTKDQKWKEPHSENGRRNQE